MTQIWRHGCCALELFLLSFGAAFLISYYGLGHVFWHASKVYMYVIVYNTHMCIISPFKLVILAIIFKLATQ